VLVAHGGVTAAQRYAATRPGAVAFALMDERGGIHGRNVDTPFRSASMTKAMLLVAVLRRAADRPLTGDEQNLLGPMITKSDNDAADEVYEGVGDLGLQAVAQAAHMRHLQPVGALFETRITAADQARFFFRIDRLVPPRHRGYARQLLHGIIAPHWWGIATVARARHFTVYFKSGWRKDIEHQAALLERFGRRVSLAVLTSGESAADGRATEAGIAARVLAP
jgi:Beta-lactamase enzyme family